MANFSSELLPFYLVASGPPRPGPGSLFPRRKSDQNAAGDTPVPDFCPIGLYQWGDFSATESRSFSNLQSGGQRYSACRPLKGGHVSRGSWQNNFLVSHPREYPKKFRAGPIYAGESKGGKPPLCRRGGGVHRGGTPSKALWGMPLRGRVHEHAFGYREITAILKATGKITEALKTARCATVHPEGERG